MSLEINPKLEEGDRVILIVMSDPYSPVTVGTKGTVTGKGSDPWSKEPLYYVKWDNGRTLNLVGDEDVWVKDVEKKEEVIFENFSNTDYNSCNTLSEGRQFCNKLSGILKSGIGGKNASNLKKYVILLSTCLYCQITISLDFCHCDVYLHWLISGDFFSIIFH